MPEPADPTISSLKRDSVSAQPVGERTLVINGCCMAEHMTVVSTGAGLVVVDTLATAVHTRAALPLIRDFSPEPVRYVINTHFDIDHYAGNQWFPEAVIIGHHHLRRHEQNRMYDDPGNKKDIDSMIASIPSLVPGDDAGAAARREVYTSWFRSLLTGFEGFVYTRPDFLLQGDADIALGDITVEIRHQGPGHTDADLLVLVPSEQLVVSGDLVMGEGFLPVSHRNHGGNVRNMISILKNVEELADRYTHLVPGHGGITRPPAAASQREYLEKLLALVAGACRRGLTPEEARKSLALPEYASCWLYELAHASNILAAWPS